MTTINDVAKKAGVSVSTVSKVLKSYPNISTSTREKVNAAINELNYVPNVMASALSSKKNNRVAMWINFNEQRQSIDELNMQYIFGAFNKAKELNVNLIPVFSPMFIDKDANELERYLRSEGVSGVISFGINKNSSAIIQLIEKQVFKCVVVDAPNVNEKTSSVTVDHFTGQYAVAKKTVLDGKCDHVLYLAGKADGYVTDMRIAGIEKLQRELGFNLLIEHADFSERKARELTFKHYKDVDVIVCASDLMAIGAKNALKELDVFRRVCGYDGISLMGYAGEHMNTIKQDFFSIAEVAVEEVQRLMNGEVGRSVLLDFELIQMNYEDIIF